MRTLLTSIVPNITKTDKSWYSCLWDKSEFQNHENQHFIGWYHSPVGLYAPFFPEAAFRLTVLSFMVSFLKNFVHIKGCAHFSQMIKWP